MKIFTIGFTKTSAQRFFERLKFVGAKKLVDVRLNNVSQLAGFAKRDDIQYFSKTICNMDYVHLSELAPTKTMLDSYKKERGAWRDYEQKFLALMRERRIEDTIDKNILDQGCLLCSEDKPHYCHRRLVAEYLKQHWGDVEIIHL